MVHSVRIACDLSNCFYTNSTISPNWRVKHASTLNHQKISRGRLFLDKIQLPGNAILILNPSKLFTEWIFVQFHKDRPTIRKLLKKCLLSEIFGSFSQLLAAILTYIWRNSSTG